MSMSPKSKAEAIKKQLVVINELLKKPENKYCADCKKTSPTWASVNLGVFVCINCSGCHREIGVHITKIRSTNLDVWPKDILNNFKLINNKIANKYWECKLKKFDFKKIQNDKYKLVEFIRNKYENKLWIDPSKKIDPMSLISKGKIKKFKKLYCQDDDEENEEDDDEDSNKKKSKKTKKIKKPKNSSDNEDEDDEKEKNKSDNSDKDENDEEDENSEEDKNNKKIKDKKNIPESKSPIAQRNPQMNNLFPDFGNNNQNNNINNNPPQEQNLLNLNPTPNSANNKKEKLNKEHIRQNNEILSRANTKKMNDKSYKLLEDRNNRRIKNAITKFEKKENKLNIVGMAQCLYELNMINELIKPKDNLHEINMNNQLDSLF